MPAFAAYIGFYPKTTVLKTWKRVDSYRDLKTAWEELYRERDAFLEREGALIGCGVDLVVKVNGQPVYPAPEVLRSLMTQYPLPKKS